MWEIIRANRRKSALLIGLLGSVLALLGGAIGYYFFPAEPMQGVFFGCLIALGIWMILLLTSMTSGEKVLLATAGARQISHDDAPQLYNIVEEMKIASGLPAVPKVYIMDSHVPNAFAVGLKPERAAVAVTSGLLSKLNRDELQGVIAHELGHIVNRDTLYMTMAGVTVGAVVIISDLFLRGLWFSGGGSRRRSSKEGGQLEIIIFVATILLAILAPLLSQLLYLATSRKREYLADASAAQFTRYPEGLASALEKISDNQEKKFSKSRTLAPMFIVNPMAAWEGSSGLFSTHPPTAERVRILRRMTKGSSLQAYETCVSQSLSGRTYGSCYFKVAKEKGIRKADEESKKAHDPQKNLRQVKGYSPQNGRLWHHCLRLWGKIKNPA